MVTNPVTKECTFEVPNPMLGYVLVLFRYMCMLGFYGGALAVIFSIYLYESPGGAEATLPVSPTVKNVVNLTCQFFFVYFMVSVMLTISEVTGGAVPMDKWKLFSAINSAKTTLAFAPMLSILFVTTRMYALLLTDQRGAPQAYVQSAMTMCTWSLLISFVMCLGSGLLMDEVETDEDGNVVNKFSNQYVGMAVTTIRYISMLLLYGGMATVVYGLFTMTAQNANGEGSVPYWADGQAFLAKERAEKLEYDRAAQERSS